MKFYERLAEEGVLQRDEKQVKALYVLDKFYHKVMGKDDSNNDNLEEAYVEQTPHTLITNHWSIILCLAPWSIDDACYRVKTGHQEAKPARGYQVIILYLIFEKLLLRSSLNIKVDH